MRIRCDTVLFGMGALILAVLCGGGFVFYGWSVRIFSEGLYERVGDYYTWGEIELPKDVTTS